MSARRYGWQNRPGIAKTAREEGFSEISDWFETLGKAEHSYAGKFVKALDTL